MSSNPITSVAPSSSPITSVSAQRPAPALGNNNNPQHFTRLNLELRGQLFPVDRETLMLLPESVLLGLFPQGLVLSKPATWEGGDDGVFAVDVSGLPSLLSAPSRHVSSTILSPYIVSWRSTPILSKKQPIIRDIDYISTLISSSTLNASHTSYPSGPKPNITSTALRPLPVYSTLKNHSLKPPSNPQPPPLPLLHP